MYKPDLKECLIDLDKYEIIITRSEEMLIKNRRTKEQIYKGEKPVVPEEHTKIKNPRIFFYDGHHFFFGHGTEILMGDLPVNVKKGTMVYSSGVMKLYDYLLHRKNAERIIELDIANYLRGHLQDIKYKEETEKGVKIEELVKKEEVFGIGNEIKVQILRKYTELMRKEKFPVNTERWAMRRAKEHIKAEIDKRAKAEINKRAKSHETSSR
ncbi:MAG: hypothetical protein JSV39_03865 [Candidatus Aenigmatarchaeota archaeon]|nr:MAG: hypothetical protein JSV39_03865 [Candidatus Aenigmarchaeota archaeon]